MCCTKSKIVAAHNFVKDAAGRKIAHRMQRPSNAARLSYSTRFRLILYSPRHYFKSARFREVSSIGKDGATVAVGRAITYCPPAQIRTCRINVYGSCLGFLRQSELWDKDAWLALGIGMNDRANAVMRAQFKRCCSYKLGYGHAPSHEHTALWFDRRNART